MNEYNRKRVKQCDLFFYNFGENVGSVQNGIRPVLVLQTNKLNDSSPNVIVAAVTSVNKKANYPFHVKLGKDFGLQKDSMVLLEQIRTVNKSSLLGYVGNVDRTEIRNQINKGLHYLFDNNYSSRMRDGTIVCLCRECLDFYLRLPETTVHRMDRLRKASKPCFRCGKENGYDYIIFAKHKAF